jgi:hypothetical protein
MDLKSIKSVIERALKLFGWKQSAVADSREENKGIP